jgi:hypothetical protein
MKPSSRQLDNAISWNRGIRRPQGKWLSIVFFYTRHERKNKRKSLIIRHAPRWNRTNNPVIKSLLLSAYRSDPS